MSAPSFRSHLVAALLLAGLVLLALGASLRGQFVWDDRPLIAENRRVQESSEIPEILTSSFWETGDRHDRFRSFFRPVVHLSYAMDHALWGLRPAGFHGTNLVLHFLCCWVVYLLALEERLPSRCALAGAGLFAVHPVHVESVAWISGRTDLVCGLFLLASFLAYRRAEGRPGSGAWRAAAPALFALALFSKEMAATLPLLVFLHRWLTGAGGERRLRRALSGAWPFLAVLAGYLVIRQLVLAHGAEPLIRPGLVPALATALFVTARYVTLLLLPVRLDAHYPYAPLESLLAPVVWISALMLFVLLWVSRRWMRSSPRSLFWLCWIFVGLLPVMAFGRFGDVIMADRFLYLPSAGLALLAARALGRFRSRGQNAARLARAVAAACIVVIAGSTLLSWKRCAVWHDDYRLFSGMVRTSPGSALVRCNLGLALYERGELDAAVAEFKRAILLNPTYAMAHNNLAATLEREGRWTDALRHYRRALTYAPGLLEAGVNAGHLTARLESPAAGISMLREIVRNHPDSTQARYALAEALNRVGRNDAALPHVERALRSDPSHPGAHYLLGKIRSEQGRPAEAAASMRRFLELWPEQDEYAAAAGRVIDRERTPRE